MEQHPLLKKLFNIMTTKKTNLCVAANFETFDEILSLVDRVGDHICILKTQLDLLLDKTSPAINLEILCEKKKKYNFLLFEDKKFLDGPATVRGFYKNYSRYVDLVTAHSYSDEMFEKMQEVIIEAKLPDDEPRGCLAVCDMSFENYLHQNCNDAEKNFEIAKRNTKICVGIISQKIKIPDGCPMIKATPGVHMSKTSDGQGQQWNHPSKAMANGADIIIVGRGITAVPEDDQEKVACEYKQIAWEAYSNKIGKR